MRRFLLSFVLVFAFSLFGETKYGIPNRRGEHAIPLDWSTCTFDEAIDETFGIKLMREDRANFPLRYMTPLARQNIRHLIQEYNQILTHRVTLKNICKYFYSNNRNTTHIALVRILLYGNDGNCYVYNIPYAFLSGEQFIGNIIVEENLRPAFKNIFSFNFVSDIGEAQHFAHSERAIGLFLKQENILKEIKSYFSTFTETITPRKTIIQIMTKNSMCPSCAKFWREEAGFTNNAGVHIFIRNENQSFQFFHEMKTKLGRIQTIFIKTIYTIEK